MSEDRIIASPEKKHDCAGEANAYIIDDRRRYDINTVKACGACGRLYVLRNATGVDFRTHPFWRRLRWWHLTARRLVADARGRGRADWCEDCRRQGWKAHGDCNEDGSLGVTLDMTRKDA